jgi:hypothetical protein
MVHLMTLSAADCTISKSSMIVDAKSEEEAIMVGLS